MSQLFDAIIEFFNADEWPYAQLEQSSALRMGFQGDNGNWLCYANVREERQQFLFYSVCPVNAPPDKRPLLAEFLTRANYDLPIGNFELDFDDGEIRFKTSADIEGDRLSDALLKNLVYTNVITMDHYLPGIMSVLYGETSPLEAINRLENGNAQPQKTVLNEQAAA
jgi:hypothetical protein